MKLPRLSGPELRPFSELHATPRGWKPSTATNRRRHRRSDLAHSRNLCLGGFRSYVDLAQLILQHFTVVRVFRAVYFGCAMSSSTSSTPKVPKSVIIVGSGAFGLSTAWALCRNPEFTYTSITVVDRQTFPTPDGSSVSELPQIWVATFRMRTRPERNMSQKGSYADHTTSRLIPHALFALTTLRNHTTALQTLPKTAGAPTLRPRSTTRPVSL